MDVVVVKVVEVTKVVVVAVVVDWLDELVVEVLDGSIEVV